MPRLKSWLPDFQQTRFLSNKKPRHGGVFYCLKKVEAKGSNRQRDACAPPHAQLQQNQVVAMNQLIVIAVAEQVDDPV